LHALSQAVATAARAGQAFDMPVRLTANGRYLRVHGGPAPPPLGTGTVVLWFSDASRAEDEKALLTREREDLGEALTALGRLIEAAPFPIWHRAPDLSLALVNDAYVRAVEASDAGAVIDRGIELLEAGSGVDGRAAAAAARDAGHALSRTVPATVGGERRILRVDDVPIGNGAVAGYAIDVQDLESARSDLARFANAQRAMLDRLSSGVAQFGADRALTFWNQPFARLFDMPPDWLAERPEFDRVLERMRDNHQLPEVRDFPEWKADRRDWFLGLAQAIEEAWLLPGGAHLRVVAQPLPDGGLLLIFEDRTEQVQLASARDTLLRVRTATFDNLFEAIGVFAGDGRMYLWNTRFRDTWGLDEDQLASHPRVDALVPLLGRQLADPSHAGLVRELVRGATAERQQQAGRVTFADGRHFEFAAVPLPDGNALFTMLDVTDSRRIETALRERTEALEDADRVKTAFVAGMSYELRTPLTSIAGFAEMLAAGYGGALEEGARDYVGAILEATDRLGKLIDDVLDLTQTEAGGGPMRTQKVDLRALCQQAGSAFAATAAEAKIELVLHIEDGVGTVDGEPRRLREALHHLLRNAVAHTPAGGRVLLHGDGDRGEAMLTVSDNGSGIPPAEQAHLFDRFRRMPSGGGGISVGLGLPLTRQFIEAHGGSVSLLSEPGEGTSVTIRLPRGR
jgi:signal transduction histidine kinase